MSVAPPAGPVPNAGKEPDVRKRKFRFPTAFTVLAAVLLLVWIATFFVPAGAYKTNEAGEPVPGSYKELASCTPKSPREPLLTLFPDGRRATAAAEAAAAPPTVPAAGEPCVDTSFTFRFKQLWISPANGLYGVEGQRVRRPVEEGFLYGSAGNLPVRPRRRRVHHDDDEDGVDPDRHRPAGAPLPSQRLDPDRDPDARVRARRHLLRHVGGDARLLRPARAARAGPGLRPDGRGRDHLPRRRLRRDRVDRQPVLDRRRLGRGRDQHRRRDRPADRALDRARDARDRLRDLVRAPGPAASGPSPSSASRPPTRSRRRASSATCRS